MNFDSLVHSIHNVQHVLQEQTAHAINQALTVRNWVVGYYIVEYEQNGEDRAQYGDKVLQKLEAKLHTKGMTVRRFREFRKLYTIYPQLIRPIYQYLQSRLSLATDSVLPLPYIEQVKLPQSTENQSVEIRRSLTAELEELIPAERIFSRIPVTHLILLSDIDNPVKRAFYELETMQGCWSVRELERQINSLYYERAGFSKNKELLSAITNNSALALTPKEVVNTPVVLEFLELNEKACVTESDLEQAILDHLQDFFLEMGQGFCFEGRQRRILIDNDYYKVDLVFYHRILKCHVLIELKLDKFRHEHASQLNMYLNYFKAEVMQTDDNPPIGILLCTDHGVATVQYATAGMDENLFIRKYKLNLPDEQEIVDYIQRNI